MEKTKSENKKRRLLWLLPLLLLLFGGLFLLAADLYTVLSSSSSLRSPEQIEKEDYDCVIVFGAGVKKNGQMSDMLTDRVETAVSLYLAGRAKKLLFSGDHGSSDYDEVNAMRRYALGKGVPSEDIFTDHAGFSTYESIYRAKEVFCVSSAVLVTQKYHLFRALAVADAFGIESVGVPADIRVYRGGGMREAREVLARAKDLVFCFFRPLPTYLGEKIPISGNGENSIG